MENQLKKLTIDINTVDISDILSCWLWQITNLESVYMITVFGDIFYIGKDKGIYWLQSDCGDLVKVAENIEQFQKNLLDENKFDEWFLPQLVENLINAGKILKENQVYSYKIFPIIGGEYTVDNIEPTDISVHFALTGQICEQIKELPDGSKINIVVKK